jgi:HPt (histidine-containing phosphotransfer) domain-containing protein
MNDPVKAFDVDAALERMGGDSELLAELVDAFLQHAPEILHQIEGAAADGEARALEAAAHSLKGMAVYLDAMPVATLAERLEIMGHGRDLGKVREAVSDLASSMDELCEALSTFHLDRGPRKLV